MHDDETSSEPAGLASECQATPRVVLARITGIKSVGRALPNVVIDEENEWTTKTSGQLKINGKRRTRYELRDLQSNPKARTAKVSSRLVALHRQTGATPSQARHSSRTNEPSAYQIICVRPSLVRAVSGRFGRKTGDHRAGVVFLPVCIVNLDGLERESVVPIPCPNQ